MDPISVLCQQEFDRVFERKTYLNLVFNGTAANVLCLTSTLKRFQAVICSDQAHLLLDEGGAPEVVGHTKLIPLPSVDGKIFSHQAEGQLTRQGDQHHSQIKMVSLTQPTELGTCYTVDELLKWRAFCDQNQFLLHCDGTRLSNALVSQNESLKTYGRIFDLISFGGTKNGLMGAEAVVCFDETLAKDFKFYRKQLLNLPSKTRFLSVQYLAYLKDDLYLEIARQVFQQAKNLEEELLAFPELKIKYPVQSNGVFVSIPKGWIKALKEEFFFYIWDPHELVARLMISFDWNDKDTERFIQVLRKIKEKANLNV